MPDNETLLKPKIASGYNQFYSRRIQRLRFILPLIALVIAAVVFSWSFIDSDKLLPSPQTDSAQKPAQSALVAPNFQSIDDKGRPFSITATEAIQDKTNADIVYLSLPKAVLQLDENQTVTLSAQKGTYAQSAKNIALDQDVLLSDNQAFMLKTSTLNIDFQKSLAKTRARVTGENGQNTLDAKGGMIVDAQSNIITLIGPAQVILYTDNSNVLF